MRRDTTTMTDHNQPPRCTCDPELLDVGKPNSECRLHGSDANRHPHYRDVAARKTEKVRTGNESEPCICLPHSPLIRPGCKADTHPFTAESRAHRDPLSQAEQPGGPTTSMPRPAPGEKFTGTLPGPVCHVAFCDIREPHEHHGSPECDDKPCDPRTNPMTAEWSTTYSGEGTGNIGIEVPDDGTFASDMKWAEAVDCGLGAAVPQPREVVLDTAKSLICGDRQASYGDATESFSRLARLWSEVIGVDIMPEQVALCLTLLKVSRLVASPDHADSWVDICGYAALGGEIAQRGDR
ncbi:hypothetical protein PBI_THONKO_59 [Mycobacterium phage Thonko]|uniref:DUF6378 domain-containing protein n=1 Tax=Mycobacterium phage Thonko TaxID=2282910 RepID=A0A346FCA6_9CAUD|nr:phosphofructokinase [Mycobacterium phage Thonko]AXN53331.1 hypothetical protein PBI_THONKO_59 [Mycobacterium phage Thonko]